MKYLHLTYHFEFADRIEAILDRHELSNYVRYSMMEGRDRDGKHFGTQVYPGNVDVIQAQVPEEKLDMLLKDLESFKKEKEAHRHLEALVLPIERTLS